MNRKKQELYWDTNLTAGVSGEVNEEHDDIEEVKDIEEVLDDNKRMAGHNDNKPTKEDDNDDDENKMDEEDDENKMDEENADEDEMDEEDVPPMKKRMMRTKTTTVRTTRMLILV